MTREIKFRAWDKEAKEMRLVRAEDLHSLEFKLSAKYGELMQYTGLKDKNGKETFSDDIISDGINTPFVVDLWNWPLMVRLSQIEFEIIGNIYENPELLK